MINLHALRITFRNREHMMFFRSSEEVDRFLEDMGTLVLVSVVEPAPGQQFYLKQVRSRR